MPPSTTDEDGKSMSSSSYVHASQMAGSTIESGSSVPRTKRSKAQLWQDMKINAVTRALTLLYTLSLLALLTRIQLNLLGRRTYLSSVVAMASSAATQQSDSISLENKDDDNYDNIYGNDFETNRKYLTFSWWLLHRGSKQILANVQAAVKDVFGSVNIREDMSLERLSELIMEVRRKIEGATEEDRHQKRWLVHLLPPRDEESFVVRQAGSSEGEGSPSYEATPSQVSNEEEQINGSLRRLLDETSDLIDSPTFSQVLTRLLDAGYSNLVDYRIATEAYQSVDPSSSAMQGMSAYEGESRISEIIDTKAKLAHILPVFCRQAHVIAAGSGDLESTLEDVPAGGNEYLTVIDRVDQLSAFAAVIYSSNFEQEVTEGARKSSTGESTERYSRPTAAGVPGQTSQVLETRPQAVVDSLLSENDDGLPVGAAQESAPSGAEQSVGGDFEAAWNRALSEEDGKSVEAADH